MKGKTAEHVVRREQKKKKKYQGRSTVHAAPWPYAHDWKTKWWLWWVLVCVSYASTGIDVSDDYAFKHPPFLPRNRKSPWSESVDRIDERKWFQDDLLLSRGQYFVSFDD